MVEAMRVCSAKEMWKPLCPPLNFAMNLSLLQKIVFKQQKMGVNAYQHV